VWAWAASPGQEGAVGPAVTANPSSSYLCQLSQSGSQAATLADTTGSTADGIGLLQPQSTSLEAALASAVEQGMQQGRLALLQALLPRHLAIPGTYYCPPQAVRMRAYRQERRQAAASSQALLARPVTVSKLVQPLTRLQACSEASVFMREARESWQPTLHMMGFDVGKELQEDALLGDSGDVPGLVPTGERSFDFMQKEVHTQLAHLPARERDTILGVLADFEPTVFETREMPRTSPRRSDMIWIFLNDRVHDP